MKILVITSAESAARAELVHLHLFNAGHQVERIAGQPANSHAALDLSGAVKRADVLVAILPGGPDTFAAIGMAIAAGKPVIAWDEGEVLDTSAACWHPSVQPLRGDLGKPENREALVYHVASVLDARRSGELGRGAWGHARAIAARLAGGPTA